MLENCHNFIVIFFQIFTHQFVNSENQGQNTRRKYQLFRLLMQQTFEYSIHDQGKIWSNLETTQKGKREIHPEDPNSQNLININEKP